jgi:hypothetical protein
MISMPVILYAIDLFFKTPAFRRVDFISSPYW